LQKRVMEAQRNLDLALQKRDQAAVDDALDRDRILNIAFAAKPSASSVPVQPRPALYLALGLFVAAFLGIGACVVTELGRNTIHSPAELDAITGLTTLVAVPLQKRGASQFRLGLDNGDLYSTLPLTIPHETQMQVSLQPFVARSKS
jgi:hypothetical protein